MRSWLLPPTVVVSVGVVVVLRTGCRKPLRMQDLEEDEDTAFELSQVFKSTQAVAEELDIDDD